VTSVIWSPQSLHEVESIRAYIAEDSAAYAELVVRRIVAAVERLHAFPESGRMVPERNAPDIREVIVSPYRVVYRLGPGVVETATVFRGYGSFPTTFASVGPTVHHQPARGQPLGYLSLSRRGHQGCAPEALIKRPGPVAVRITVRLKPDTTGSRSHQPA
jgi:toxin ParE1/3/4